MINKIFNFDEREVRTVFDNNQTWFVAKDVCEILEFSKYRDVLGHIDEDERVSMLVDTLGGAQDMICVNESGLYHLIFRSRKPIAKQFRKWVTSEVLPTIRKQGFYQFTKFNEDELRYFIERFFPDQVYGEISDVTGIAKNIPVSPHFRSCKIAKKNDPVQPELPLNNNREEN